MTRSRAVSLLASLVGALLLAIWANTPPAAVGLDAPPTRFSAAGAMQVVAAVARAPHPIGSPEAAAVRAEVAMRMRRLGMIVTPLRRVAVAERAGDRTVSAGRAETLVGVLPGRDRTLPAIALMAHTDSVPDSFGAADDGAGLAVALETVRGIRDGPPVERDVMLIATDGEEAGLLGARAFFADPIWVRRIGAIVNIDARGTSGLGAMFETGPESGGLVARYRAVSTHRFAHSAATFLYRLLPNSTDLTAAMASARPALNFAFLDGEFDYHTPRDRLASLDPRTLQSLGDQILPVVRDVAATRALPARGEDGVFGDTALFALRYPAWAGWLLVVATLALTAWSARGRRPGEMARAAAGAFAIAAAAMLAARLGYGLTGVGEDWAQHHRIMAVFGRYEAALGLTALACLLGGLVAMRRGLDRWRAALALLGTGIATVLLGQPALPAGGVAIVAAGLAVVALGAPISAPALRSGMLAAGAILSIVLQLVAPALTPLLLWPTLIAAIGAALARRWPDRAWVDALVALVPLAYLLVFAHAVLLALGIPTPGAVAPFALVAAILLAPLAMRAAAPAAALLTVAAALFLSIRGSAPTERHPALSQLWGVIDPDGRSWRVSTLERLDPWTRTAMRADGGAIKRAATPILSDASGWRASAKLAPLPRPTIRVARAGSSVTVHAAAVLGGRELRLLIAVDRPAREVSINHVPARILLARAGSWRLRWRSDGEPLTLRFRITGPTRLGLLLGETTERRLSVPTRADNVATWLGSNHIVVTSRGRWNLPS